MTVNRHFETVSFWLECVATTIVAAVGRLMSPRAVTLVEDDDGSFAIEADAGGPSARLRIADGRVVGRLPEDVATMLRGSALQLVLRPHPFLFRRLELPRRAAEYLAGIVRAQIDRLTPWSADDAVFGWSGPTEVGADRIAVTVAATARAKIAPYVQALGELGAQSIAVFTAPQSANAGADAIAAGAAPIQVLVHQRSSVLDVRHVQRVLAAVLLGAVVLAGAAAGANIFLGGNLDTRRDEIARKIAERRTAIRAGGGGELGTDTAAGAERTLERRKHASPSVVLVLEALSQILPDHTYVTELRIEADKLRLIGVTQDAPSLIRLIEQSPQFTRATFFAPTTRAPSDPGERFHIEAHIEPVFSPRS
jgi:general secretion pathway protein L